MDIRYPAQIELQKDGSYFVQFIDLHDTFTEGQTLEEALFNAAEVLSAMLAAGRHRPQPQRGGSRPRCLAPRRWSG